MTCIDFFPFWYAQPKNFILYTIFPPEITDTVLGITLIDHVQDS